MKLAMYKIPAFTLILLITACGSETIKPNKPVWIDNPEQGAAGFSSAHIRGRYYQEELAISRARERLAACYGVEISSVQTIRERVVNEKAYITSDRQINPLRNRPSKPRFVRPGTTPVEVKFGYGSTRLTNS